MKHKKRIINKWWFWFSLIAVLFIAVVSAIKAYEYRQLEGDKWGFKVTKNEDNTIGEALSFEKEAISNIDSSVDKVKNLNQKIIDSIDNNISKTYDKKSDAAKGIDDPDARKKAEEYSTKLYKMDLKSLISAEELVSDIDNIVDNAKSEKRKLSAKEHISINEKYRSLTNYHLKSIGFTKEKRDHIIQAFFKSIK